MKKEKSNILHKMLSLNKKLCQKSSTSEIKLHRRGKKYS